MWAVNDVNCAEAGTRCEDPYQLRVTSRYSVSLTCTTAYITRRVMCALPQSIINQYVFSAPSTQVRADEALQMSSQYTYS